MKHSCSRLETLRKLQLWFILDSSLYTTRMSSQKKLNCYFQRFSQDLKGFHRNRRDLQISTDLIVRVSVSLEKLQKAGDNKRTLLLLNLSLPWIPTNGQIINGRVSPCLQIRPIVIVSGRWQAYALALFPPSWQLPRWGPGMRTAPHKPHPPPLLVRLTPPSALTPFNRNRPYTKLAAGKQKNYQIEQ